ncbi:protein NRT1/ PTR FAMILY 6.2-like [Pyrus communis]|uniref:protein NRT1/ PTR FAMILY 6.2-like n=1 Tax=Pyrus communis TaxID=23211 RepID=UPI0035BFFE61
MVIRQLPIWATTIIFWTSYAQMMDDLLCTSSIHHGQVDRKFSNPTGWLSHRLLCTKINVAKSGCEFRLHCNNTGFTKLQKMAIGLVLATIGMGAAALGERKKLAVAKANGGLSPLLIRVFLLPQFLAGGCR